ncbi:LacI family transcriptional regulator [Labrys miyagiensis]|uniref:LacI family transcriptional regulator n=1 Tax=Labrys miyagiensis TaxID=346912 RepID=A0ABQ6CI62_9HYPH|nr:substrate-binding domain-containing protein [Labrys miyagiensis]GLS19459.1 LacI family transcriptional regulator [Labrys miyagiensis]
MPRAAGGRRSTIYDIAEATSASPSTVSLVLNGSWTRYRIKEETAKRILKTAGELGYAVNMKARGLRLSRSGLAGMIIPHYRNRFFAGLAEAFEAESRKRGLCPIVVSGQREEEVEANVTSTLLSQQVEFLFFAGVHNTSPLNALCHAAGIPCINIDLPGNDAPSVVTDNYGGAYALTENLLRKIKKRKAHPRDLFFLGGVPGEHATEQRLAGFRDAVAASDLGTEPEVLCCGYRPSAAKEALIEHFNSHGRMPGGLFINSITTFEGLMQFSLLVPRSAMHHVSTVCSDWDPFGAHLPFDVTMTRQNVEALIAEGYALVDNYTPGQNPVVVVPPEFAPSQEKETIWR